MGGEERVAKGGEKGIGQEEGRDKEWKRRKGKLKENEKDKGEQGKR